MGFHVCSHCDGESGSHQFLCTSSGDITLTFEHGDQRRVYTLPDMIFHYVGDHRYLPPEEFVEAVMGWTLIGAESTREQTRDLTKSSAAPMGSMCVGYLDGPYSEGDVPQEFLDCLAAHVNTAAGYDVVSLLRSTRR